MGDREEPRTVSGPYARGVERHQRLLTSARAACADSDSTLTLSSIAAAAGLTDAGALHHFPGRDAMIVAAADDHIRVYGLRDATGLAVGREILRIALDRRSHASRDARTVLRRLCEEREADAVGPEAALYRYIDQSGLDS